jgi:large subunit ribosomal protein L40
MVDACNQLDQITADTPQRAIYDRAMAKPSPVQIKGKGPEARWLEARIEGLVPREAWVPTETRGKGWNYDWKRPAQKN